jgi:glycosyltransferase involved in cell wall biosynthesis
VHWFARLPDEQYRQAIQGSDLIVLPLHKSTAVGTVLEGMASGVPVITNAGGIEDYLSPDCSIVRPSDDAKGMIDAAVDILSDRRQLAIMGQLARRWVEQFSWPLVAKRFGEIYGKLN